MNNNQLHRLEDAEQRAEAIPTEDEPDAGVEFCTINVVYYETVLEGGDRREVKLPATYDDNVPFRAKFFHQSLKRWQRWRVRYPIEHPDDGPYTGKE
jgi:hypothetical protein